MDTWIPRGLASLLVPPRISSNFPHSLADPLAQQGTQRDPVRIPHLLCDRIDALVGSLEQVYGPLHSQVLEV